MTTAFKEKYIDACNWHEIAPLQHLLDKLAMPSKVSSSMPGSKESVETALTNRELNLSNQTINSKMAKSLAVALEADQLFVKISLADCLMGDDGCISICNALRNHEKIEDLDLRGNNIRADGALALSHLIKVNPSIKRISLEWNCIGIWEAGIKAIGDSLSLNQGMTDFDLRNNKIGPQGASVLATGLKNNTCLRRLDLRWNNVGLIGARALLDMLKWNQTVQNIEVTGNDIPDDLARAIDMALERNRQHFNADMEASTRAQFLSNTLQQITVEHEETIQLLKSKTMFYETESASLGQKLQDAFEEVETSHLGFKVLETKLAEERHHREKAEGKAHDLEEILLRERREFSERCQALLSDVVKEREEKRSIEESYRTQALSRKEFELTLDSKLKEAELRQDRAQRDKQSLEEEYHRLKEAFNIMKADRTQEVEALETSLRDKQKAWQAKSKALEEQLETGRVDRSEWDAKLREIEGRIRQEEAAKRQDLISKLQQLTQQRDGAQHSLNMLNQTHRQVLTELEQRGQKEKEQIAALQAQLAQLSQDKSGSIEENRKLIKQLRDEEEKSHNLEKSLDKALKKTAEEKAELEAEVKKLRNALDKLKDEEVSRARDLERAIVGYVKSVERASSKTL